MMIRNITPRLAERGKIKIGKKGPVRTTSQGKTFQIPQKLDHFVVTTLERDADNNFIVDREAQKLFGERPTSLPIRLMFDDAAQNFSSRYAAFRGKKLWCAGNGVEATRQNGAGPVKVQCPCERIAPEYQGQDKCKFNGNLSVMLDGMPGVGGVWSFRTTSYNSVVNIMSALAQIKLITGGPLAGIPLNLVLRAKQTASPTDGAMQTVYIASVEYPGTVDELQELGLERLRRRVSHGIQIKQLEEQAQKLLLPSPTSGVFDAEEEEDISAEFYPSHDAETGEVLEPVAPASRLDALEKAVMDSSAAAAGGTGSAREEVSRHADAAPKSASADAPDIDDLLPPASLDRRSALGKGCASPDRKHPCALTLPNGQMLFFATSVEWAEAIGELIDSAATVEDLADMWDANLTAHTMMSRAPIARENPAVSGALASVVAALDARRKVLIEGTNTPMSAG